MFDTNVFGVIVVTNAMLPLLRRSPAPRIVNVEAAALPRSELDGAGRLAGSSPFSRARQNTASIQGRARHKAGGHREQLAIYGTAECVMRHTVSRHAFSRRAMAYQVSQDLPLGNFDRMVWLESKEPPVVENE
ncbi:hypothetical protein OG820_38180 [Streptomyces sp. NBC_00211]